MGKKRLPWRPSDIIALRMLYPNHDNETIGRALARRRTWSAVQNMAVKLGLKKSPSFLNSPKCRFQKGATPWNRGVTGYMGANRTSFRKGALPHNHRPVGSERVSDGVLLRKVTDTRRRSDWKPVKDIIWEAKRGPIPRGRFVRLKKPQGPLTLRNIELVDRAANMRRNTYHRYPKEVARLIQLRGALNRQINRRQREEQDRRPSQSSVRGNREGQGRRHAIGSGKDDRRSGASHHQQRQGGNGLHQRGGRKAGNGLHPERIAAGNPSAAGARQAVTRSTIE